MTEHIQDQISAFIDDELSNEESAFFARRLERDADTRRKLLRYMTMGATLRGDLLPPDSGVLRRRIQDSLDGVAVPRAVRARPAAANGRYLKPLLGTGIAAGVAVLVLFVLRGASELGVDGALGDPSQPLQAVESSEPASYVVPQDPPFGGAITPPIRYTNYLMHHGEYASGLNRTLVRSNVVSVRESDIGVEGEDAFE
jgi:negative regulator of sigma E activity